MGTVRTYAWPIVGCVYLVVVQSQLLPASLVVPFYETTTKPFLKKVS